MRTNEFNKFRNKILNKIKASHNVVTTAEIAAEFELSWNTAEKYLMELALENRVMRIKKAGVNLWIIKRD